MKEQDFFKDILAESKLELQSSDFEDDVMMFIEKNHFRSNTYTKELKYSWIFLTMGALLGVILSLILPGVFPPISGINQESVILTFQVIILLLIFSQLESLLGNTWKKPALNQIKSFNSEQ